MIHTFHESASGVMAGKRQSKASRPIKKGVAVIPKSHTNNDGATQQSRNGNKKSTGLAGRIHQKIVAGDVSSDTLLAIALAELPDPITTWLGPTPPIGDALYWSGMVLNSLKRFDDAEKFLTSARDTYQASNELAGHTLCQVELAWQAFNATKKTTAFDQLSSIFSQDAPEDITSTTAKQTFLEAKARYHHYLGLVAYRQGDFANGVEGFKQALAIAPKTSLEAARVWDSLAVHYERMGDFHLAQEVLKSSLQIKKRLGTLWEEAITAQIMGRLHLIQEHFRQARHYLRRSLDLSIQLGDQRRTESLYNTLIKQALLSKQLPRAHRLIDDVDALHQHLESSQPLTRFCPDKQSKQPPSFNQNTNHTKVRLKQSKEYVVTQFYRARVSFLKGEFDHSEDLLRHVAIVWLDYHGAKKDLGKAYRLLACITAKQGNYQTTVETMGQALSLFRELNLVDEQAKTHYELGQAFAKLGDRPLAIESLMEALRIAEQNGLRFMIHHIQEDIRELDADQWRRIVNHRVRHEPVFERERTLLEALTQLGENTAPESATANIKASGKVGSSKKSKQGHGSSELNLENSQTRSLISLLKVGQAISGEPNVDRLLAVVMAETKAALNCDRCTVFIHDSDKNELWSRVATGIDNTNSDASTDSKTTTKVIRFPSHLGLAGYVCKTGETLNIKNPYNDPRFNREVDKKTGYKTENLLCMPMKNRDGDIIGVFQVLNKADGPFTRADEDLLMAIASQASVSLENAQRAKDQKSAFVSFIKTLSRTIDARDPITAGHSERVAQYSKIIGEELRLGKADHEALNVSALLHDIGKIGVREDILTKEGRLTLDEYRHIQKHAEYTYDILKNIHFERHLRDVPEIAGAHHERMDGCGYFRGLSGDDIPFLGRVLALSDVFDAITSRRHYRDRMPFDRVLTIVERDTGSHFDPRVVEAFFNIPLYKLGNLLLVEQRMISQELDETFLEKLPNTLNVTIAEYHQMLKKKKRTKGEQLICTDFDAIYQQGHLDLQLD